MSDFKGFLIGVGIMAILAVAFIWATIFMMHREPCPGAHYVSEWKQEWTEFEFGQPVAVHAGHAIKVKHCTE